MPVNWCQCSQCVQQPTRFYQRDAEHRGQWLCDQHAIAAGFRHLVPVQPSVQSTKMETAVVAKRRCRPVKCIDTGEIFPNARAAAQRYGIKNIYQSINHDFALKGHRFAYADHVAAVACQPSANVVKKRGREVICIDTGERFPNAKAAQTRYGIANLSLALNHGFSAKGHRFRYADQPEIPDPRHHVGASKAPQAAPAAPAVPAPDMNQALRVLSAAGIQVSSDGVEWSAADLQFEIGPISVQVSRIRIKIKQQEVA